MHICYLLHKIEEFGTTNMARTLGRFLLASLLILLEQAFKLGVDDSILKVDLLLRQVVLLAELNHSVLECHEEVLLVQGAHARGIVLGPRVGANFVELFSSEIDFDVVILVSLRVEVLFVFLKHQFLFRGGLPGHLQVALHLNVVLELVHIYHFLFFQDGNLELDEALRDFGLLELYF